MLAKGRFSIGLLMVIVSLLAIDIALVREAYIRKSVNGPSSGYLAMVLPMANLLLLLLPRLWGDINRRAFWVGFQVVGWGVIAYLGYLDQYDKMTLFVPYEWLRSFHFFPELSAPDLAFTYTFFVFTHTPPQFLLAWLGGRLTALLARRLGVLARRSPTEESRP